MKGAELSKGRLIINKLRGRKKDGKKKSMIHKFLHVTVNQKHNKTLKTLQQKTLKTNSPLHYNGRVTYVKINETLCLNRGNLCKKFEGIA